MADSFTALRHRMVREQLEARGVHDPRVLEAMRTVPREEFLPPGGRADPRLAYADAAQPVGRGQTLSQPFMVAFMTEALALPEHARTLEIGTGTGYQTAVLARLSEEVWTVERDPVLAEEGRKRLERLGIDNVRFQVGDGSLGWEAGAPYDAILVTAGAPEVPGPLLAQLAPEGRLVIPVGSRTMQRLERVVRRPDGSHTAPETLLECRFVPLVGEEGWQSENGAWEL